MGPVDESNDDSSSENGDNSGRDPDPRGRNGNSSDDDYKEDPFDLWALRQRQLNNRDPKFESNPDHPTATAEYPNTPPGSPPTQMRNSKNAPYGHTGHDVVASDCYDTKSP